VLFGEGFIEGWECDLCFEILNYILIDRMVMIMVEFAGPEYPNCPFCLSYGDIPKSGKSRCPVSQAEFEIDDRLECIFVDTKTLRLQINGTVCGSCGLIQNHDSFKCQYCGTELNTTLQ
jgi:transposase-like protein